MSDGDLLLRNILERPDDNAARLVYADWLEEQDDQPFKDKAEFIRLSIDTDSLDGTDPVRSSAKTYFGTRLEG